MKTFPLLPGSTVGILGSGQLGRMLSLAARRMGYQTHVFSPEAHSPAGAVCDRETVAAYTDRMALQSFAAACDVVTFEFENIPTESVAWLAEKTQVRPGANLLHVAQHRLREKTFLKDAGFPIAPFHAIRSKADVEPALQAIGVPSVLKTAGFGYDGKGQHKITESHLLGSIVGGVEQEWVLEQWQTFEKEVSVLVARGAGGEMADWGVVENRHRHHILDVSFAPADVSSKVSTECVTIARAIAQKVELVGLLCIEFFVGRDGGVKVNEMAPRPHNSGHWTLEGSVTSQFEQQIRAVCGLALGSTEILTPTAMANVLGDAWSAGEPRWADAFRQPFAKWHSYGKAAPRPGRKMGHFTATAPTTAEAVRRVESARNAL